MRGLDDNLKLGESIFKGLQGVLCKTGAELADLGRPSDKAFVSGLGIFGLDLAGPAGQR